MIFKIVEEIELICENCLLVCKILVYVGSMLKFGMIGEEIDIKVEEFICDYGVVFGFKGFYGCLFILFVLCNEVVVYGLFFKEQVFEDGDIFLIDCGIYMNEFYGDVVYIFCVGDVKEEMLQFCWVINELLYLGIEQVIFGNCVGDISYVV